MNFMAHASLWLMMCNDNGSDNVIVDAYYMFFAGP